MTSSLYQQSNFDIQTPVVDKYIIIGDIEKFATGRSLK
jgi:hypothetical protein